MIDLDFIEKMKSRLDLVEDVADGRKIGQRNEGLL
jgi:hypothetical protein